MARVTVEDCIQLVADRFELVMVASQRARKIGTGAPLTVDRDRDKNPVVALREIAGSTIAVDTLKEDVIKGHQRMVVYEENDTIDMMHGEKEWGTLAEGGVQAEGMYADDQISEDDEDEDDADETDEKEGEASLADLAGNV